MNSLRIEIKALAAEQVELKNQRKTVNLVGSRTMETYKAIYTHDFNRRRLRCMYMALGILRGRTPEQVESNPKTPINMDTVNKLVEKHREKVIHTSTE